MKIALNAYFWGQENTGSGQYLHNLHANLNLATGPILLRPPEWTRLRRTGKVYFEQVQVPRRAQLAGANLIHVPYWAPPLRSLLPVVVTVHDLVPLLLPAYRRSALVRAYTSLVSAATRRAAHIIADSESTRRDLIAHLHVPPERVTVVYLGVGDHYRPVHDPEGLARTRETYGLPARYILYLGGFDPRKNVPLLLRTYARLRELDAYCPPLVIAGRLPDPQGLPALAASLGVAGQVRFIGWVSEEAKPALYSAAKLFVFLSRYEGFGLPVVEAMACGTPVVTFDVSSLPELVGEAGLQISPEDENSLAQNLADLLADEGRRRALSEAALVRAKRFSWNRAAAETEAVYRRAIANRQL